MSKNAWKTDEIGPWNNEPDSKDFTAHELHCALRRNSGGAWCGYVGVPEGHPLYQVDYSEEIKAPQERIDRANINIGVFALLFAASSDQAVRDAGIYRVDALLDCHGGLTFAGDKWPEDNGLWWFGFDCSHAGDVSPANVAWERDHGFTSEGVYRDVDYVTDQTIKLAEQLAAWPAKGAA